MLQAGIVGLPNVGKSTLFNALTRTRKAESANYPFCTIDPNVGVVQVPDARLEPLREIAKTDKIIPAAIEFVDIAGLVEGASKGEGLGNKFLANIREVDAIVHVVRCFDNDDIIHSMGSIDPIRDIDVINTELILSDIGSLESQQEKLVKKARGGDKEAAENLELIERLLPHLNETKPAITLDMNENEHAVLKRLVCSPLSAYSMPAMCPRAIWATLLAINMSPLLKSFPKNTTAQALASFPQPLRPN